MFWHTLQTKLKYRYCDRKLAASIQLVEWELLSTQWTMSVNNRLRWSHSVDDTCTEMTASQCYLEDACSRIEMQQQNQWCQVFSVP